MEMASIGAQAPAEGAPHGAQVRFTYENAELQPAKYVLTIDENGAGRFHSEPGAKPPADTASYHPLAQPLDRDIQLTPSTTDRIFATARTQKFFAGSCEEPKTRVAFQGLKQLSYQGPEGSGSCSYNWTKSVPIQKLTATLESIAFTLEEGRRLDLEHKHDRLSLDAEMSVLAEAVKDGRAMEIQTIQPVLNEIINDEAVMDRARIRARKLLDDANSSRASLPNP
jgi:hypothetical protein